MVSGYAKYAVLSAVLFSPIVDAGDSSLDAAIGGGLGGATGAAVGNEVGGRDGAILGGALGAAVGTAITTDSKNHRRATPTPQPQYLPASGGGFCPPGQAKKGRC
jgi:hypothetical protein